MIYFLDRWIVLMYDFQVVTLSYIESNAGITSYGGMYSRVYQSDSDDFC